MKKFISFITSRPDVFNFYCVTISYYCRPQYGGKSCEGGDVINKMCNIPVSCF